MDFIHTVLAAFISSDCCDDLLDLTDLWSMLDRYSSPLTDALKDDLLKCCWPLWKLLLLSVKSSSFTVLQDNMFLSLIFHFIILACK
jgi:hypothetical protein